MRTVLVAMLCCVLVACGGSERDYHENYEQLESQCQTNDPKIKCVCEGINCTFTTTKRDSRNL